LAQRRYTGVELAMLLESVGKREAALAVRQLRHRNRGVNVAVKR